MSEQLDRIPELDPGVEALLAAYAAETVRTPAQIDAMLEQVTAKLAAPAVATSTGLTIVATKLVLVSVVAGAGAWLALRASSPELPAPHVSAPSVSASSEPEERVASVISDVPPVVDVPRPRDIARVEAVAPSPAMAPRSEAPKPKRAAERPAEKGDQVDEVDDEPRVSLAAELRLLKEARRALRGGDGARALERVRTHRQDYPKSPLGEERDATEVMALCKLGRADEARAMAAKYEDRYGRSKQPLLATCSEASGEGAHE